MTDKKTTRIHAGTSEKTKYTKICIEGLFSRDKKLKASTEVIENTPEMKSYQKETTGNNYSICMKQTSFMTSKCSLT